MEPSLADSVPLLVLLAVLLMVAILLAAAEAALLRVSPIQARLLAEEGDRRARLVVSLVDDLPRVLNGVLLVVLLTQIGAATVAGYVAERHLGNLGVTLASVALTLVMFVYAEAIPKTIAVRHPLAAARLVARPVALLTRLIRPVVAALVWIADLQSPGRGVTATSAVTEAELRGLAAEAESAGQIERSDLELIERAFRVGDATAAEVAVPRIEVKAVPSTADIDSAIDLALASGHRRLPVYGSDLDDITGVARLRDLVAAPDGSAPVVLVELSAPAVPETRRVLDVLADLQEAGRTLAVVVDEHGGTTGIITVEDILEELVGDFAQDEDPGPEIEEVAPGRWLVRGTTHVDDLARILETTFDARGFHTAAGLVLDAAGRIPHPGEATTVGAHRFRVLDGSHRRIRVLEVTRAPDDPGNPSTRDEPIR